MSVHSPPLDVSLHGHLIDEVLRRSHWTDGALLGFLIVWLMLVVLRSRKPRARYDHGDSKSQVLMTLGMVLAVFFVVDGSLLYASIKGVDGTLWNWDLPRQNPETIRVEVNAHQWAWDFRTPGTDGRFSTADAPSSDDLVSWNELYVPIDTPIHVQLTATDVVHGFYLPNFRVKVDAVPGQVNQLWFQATQTGTFEIGCTQHCGTNHFQMRAVMHVLSKDAYRAWAEEAGRVATLGFDGDDRGAQWGWAWKVLK